MTRSAILAAIGLVLGACASPPTGPAFAGHNNGPNDGISILVRNNSCSIFGSCQPVRVLAFPDGGGPHPDPAPVDLGVMTSSEACFTFPVWMVSMPTVLSPVPASRRVGDPYISTPPFTPTAGGGWELNLRTRAVTPAVRCVPSD